MRKSFLALLLLPGLALAAESGPLKHGPMPEPGAAGPAHHSRVFVAETVIRNGSAVLDIPLDAPANAALVIFDAHPLTVRAPQGQALPNVPFRNPAMQSMDVPAMGARINLGGLARGAHRVNVETARHTGRLRYAVMQPASNVDLVVQLSPLAARSGQPVTITAHLAESSGTQTGVTARIRGTGAVTLLDDGRGADAVASDGIYTANFTAPRVPGLSEVAVRVDAKGQLIDGTRFRRTGTAVAMVSHSPLHLAAADVEITPGTLRIPMPAKKGHYRIEAIYGSEGRALAWARDEWNGRQRGPNVIELPRNPAADQVVIRVLDTETLALAAEFALDLNPLETAANFKDLAPPAMPETKAEAARRFGKGPGE